MSQLTKEIEFQIRENISEGAFGCGKDSYIADCTRLLDEIAALRSKNEELATISVEASKMSLLLIDKLETARGRAIATERNRTQILIRSAETSLSPAMVARFRMLADRLLIKLVEEDAKNG